MELSAQTALSDGTVIITTNQTAGRGQRGNSWETTSGMNLTFSVLLKPTFVSIKNQFHLTMMTSLAVIDFLKSNSISKAAIKWPNDILIDQKKVCGILIENSVKGETLQQSIVGIGLNINQTSFSITTATSLAQVCEKPFDLNEALNLLLEKFEKRYLQLRADKIVELKEEYLNNLFGIGEKRYFISKEKRFEGTINDVTDVGELVIISNNKKVFYNLKEISFILDF